MSLIIKEIIGQILVLALNRPEKRNALTDKMYQQLADEIRHHEQDPDIRALLIRGEGAHFTAGNDLAKFARVTQKEELNATLNFMSALSEFPMPVIAQVSGMAVGIGTTLLLHCDFVYCDETARFSMPFIDLGLVPEYASSYLLPQMAGHRKASEWLMLGESFGPEEAQQFGIINKQVTSSELSKICFDTARKLCNLPRHAMLHTKALMKSDAIKVKSCIDREIGVFVQQLNSVAAKEAFNAFLEKRQPDPAKYN